jgi:hypothetical protein
VLELKSVAVPGATWAEACVASDPDVEFVPGGFEVPAALDVPELAELLKLPPKAELEPPPSAPPELPPSVEDDADPPNAEPDPPNAEPDPPNAEPLEPELLIAETEVAPVRAPPPKLPPSERPGSP